MYQKINSTSWDLFNKQIPNISSTDVRNGFDYRLIQSIYSTLDALSSLETVSNEYRDSVANILIEALGKQISLILGAFSSQMIDSVDPWKEILAQTMHMLSLFEYENAVVLHNVLSCTIDVIAEKQNS